MKSINAELSTSNMTVLAKTIQPNSGMIVLWFGAPAYNSSTQTYGVYNWTDGFRTNTQVAQAFITAYNSSNANQT